MMCRIIYPHGPQGGMGPVCMKTALLKQTRTPDEVRVAYIPDLLGSCWAVLPWIPPPSRVGDAVGSSRQGCPQRLSLKTLYLPIRRRTGPLSGGVHSGDDALA